MNRRDRAPRESRNGRDRTSRVSLDALRLGPLQRRLFLIAFVAMLPLALFLSGALRLNASTQRTLQLGAAEDTMRAVITAVDAETNELLAALDALGTSPSLDTDDLEAFRVDALALLERRPEWGNIALTDLSGRRVMSTFNPGTPSTVTPADDIRAVIDEGIPIVGDMLTSSSLGGYGFRIHVPVYRGDEVRYVLTATTRPDSIQTLLAGQAAPEGGVVAIFDRNNRIVARSREIENWRGEKASPGMLRLLEAGGRSGWVVSRTLEDIAVYSVFFRSPNTGWSAAVGIPVAAVDAPLRRSYVLAIGSVVLSALLGLIVSFPVTRTISTPMRQLEAAAKRVKDGNAPGMPNTGLPEVQQAFSALDDAHRERDRVLKSERQARLLEQEARRLAERTSSEKDELLAMLAHEFRNPLAAISSSVELLSQLPRLPESTISQTVSIMRRQVRNLSSMTERIIEASRAMSGRIRIDRKPTDLTAVVTRAIEALRGADKLSAREFSANLDPVWVEGDPARLEQVVGNLLHNALKYTPRDASVEISLRRQGNEAVLRVRDDGMGIDPDLLPRVFDPFVQSTRTLNSSEGGFGIGLTLVRRLVELHGGSVEAHSEGADKGSEFVIRLPAIDAVQQAEIGPTERETRNPLSLSIVIVEDNDDVRASLRQLLEMGGHSVLEARDGETGVELISSAMPDLAVIDIGLPRSDGYEVARAVRQQLGQRVRLVALTAYGSEADQRRGADAGFDDYLVKPVEPRVLRAITDSLDTRAEGSG